MGAGAVGQADGVARAGFGGGDEHDFFDGAGDRNREAGYAAVSVGWPRDDDDGGRGPGVGADAGFEFAHGASVDGGILGNDI